MWGSVQKCARMYEKKKQCENIPRSIVSNGCAALSSMCMYEFARNGASEFLAPFDDDNDDDNDNENVVMTTWKKRTKRLAKRCKMVRERSETGRKV